MSSAALLLLFSLLLCLVSSIAVAGEEVSVSPTVVDVDGRQVADDEHSWNFLTPLSPGITMEVLDGVSVMPGEKETEVIWFVGSDTKSAVVRPSARGNLLVLDGTEGPHGELALMFLRHPRFGTDFLLNGRALSAKLGKHQVHLLDANTDGVHDDPLRDLVFVAGGREKRLTPVLANLLIGDGMWGVSVSEETGQVRFSPREIFGDPNRWTALVILNTLRAEAGLPECILDREISRGCDLHSKYLRLHGPGKNAHSEDPGKEGYTKEGQRAAGHAGIAHGEADAVAMVFGFHRMFYHRQHLFCTNSWRVGINEGSGPKLLDMYSGERQTANAPQPFRYPFPEQYATPVEFDSRESPDPRNGSGAGGYPISVAGVAGPITDVSAKVTAGPRHVPVKCRCSWPGKPANAAIPDNFGEILILPDGPLQPFTRYEVHLTYRTGGVLKELGWGFHTGNRLQK